MTEEEARSWVMDRFGIGVLGQIEQLLAAVVEENSRQNLISPSSIDHIWARHAVDSAQLLQWRGEARSWLDIGTGGGFPGMIAAILFDGPVTMVEPRRRRADFLSSLIADLGLGNRASVVATKVQHCNVAADIISARAVTDVENLLQASLHCATPLTRWILPRGRGTNGDLHDIARRLGVTFHVEHSVTETGSIILLVDRA